MPKKIDYVVITPPGSRDELVEDEAVVEEDAPSRGPRTPGRGGRTGATPGAGRTGGYRGTPGRSGAARPGGGLNRGGVGGGRNGGNGGRNGAIGTASGARPGIGGRGFGVGRGLGMERPTPAVAIPPSLTVKELAELMGVNPTAIISEMMKHGVLATINQQIDYETGAIVAIGLGYEVSEAKLEEEED